MNITESIKSLTRIVINTLDSHSHKCDWTNSDTIENPDANKTIKGKQIELIRYVHKFEHIISNGFKTFCWHSHILHPNLPIYTGTLSGKAETAETEE